MIQELTYCRLLKQNQDRFKHLPIGPIGLLLSVKDVKWLKAIDAATHGLHNSFIVSTFEDQEMFLKMLYGNRLKYVL
jgi:chromosome segregation ATPase